MTDPRIRVPGTRNLIKLRRPGRRHIAAWILRPREVRAVRRA
jgi:hypothetical protein